MTDEVTISTPGRICLFGEHQDYLGLPVIAAAISARLSLHARRRGDRYVHIDLPDVGDSVSFELKAELQYLSNRDYFRSAINILQRKGFSFPTGFDCRIKSEIPIAAGTSSSSALVVTWLYFLALMSDQEKHLSPATIAELAYEAEVAEFNEAGGKMDQFATAVGGLMRIDFEPEFLTRFLQGELGTFVLGNSGEPKDTQRILSRVRSSVNSVLSKVKKVVPDFSIRETSLVRIKAFESYLTREEFSLLQATIKNYELTQAASHLLNINQVDEQEVGQLLNAEQAILRDVLKISTPKIDAMISAALSAGARGAKINGSGGGGCMFAYAPDRPEVVAKAIAQAGGVCQIVEIDKGTSIEPESRRPAL